MTLSIYRKYRPQTFAEVVGQNHITQTLINEIVHNRLAHAYLFCGMRGVGKTTVARILAKSVNCQQRSAGQAEPCNHCSSCQAINEGRSLDLLEIDAASNRRIDDIREIKEHIPYGPSQARYRVIIVDEVHMLTSEAFNALLKTLEEPPPFVIFVLCTTEVHKLPATIISRCQRFDFKRLPSAVLRERLRWLAKQEGVSLEETVLNQVVELAGGSSRDAESYLGKLISLGEKNITPQLASLVLPQADIKQVLDFIEYLIKAQAAPAVVLLNSFLAEGGDLFHFYKEVLKFLRKMLLLKLGGQAAAEVQADILPEWQERLLSLNSQLTSGRLQQILERWLAVETGWQSSDLWQLPLELAVVEITEGRVPTAEHQSAAKPLPATETASRSRVPEGESSDSALTLQQVIDSWSEVVASLREFNHSLSFILSVARPLKLEGHTLTVGFSYQLHLERVKEPKIIKVVEEALAKVLGVKLHLKPETDETPNPNGDLLTNVLTTFGGRIVE